MSHTTARILRILGLVTLVFLCVFGLWGMGLRLLTGQQHAAFGNYVPWGLWVGSYVYFSGMSAGFLVVSGVCSHSDRPALVKYGPLALFAAVAALLVALTSIAVDLGHINRSVEILYHANLRSVEAWLIFMYSAELGLVCLGNALALRVSMPHALETPGIRGKVARLFMRIFERIPAHVCHAVHHRMSILEIPLALFFFGAVGALFGTVSAREFWHHPLLPIIFLVGAVLSSVGGMAVLVHLLAPDDDPALPEVFGALSRSIVVLLICSIVLDWAQISIPLWQGLTADAAPIRVLLFGKYWWSFWVGHVLLGTVVPLYMVVKWPTRRWMVAIGGGLAASTLFMVRLNQIIPPQTVELVKGQGASYHSLRASLFYFPNLFEWGVMAAILAFGWILFWFGIRVLPVLPVAGGEAHH